MKYLLAAFVLFSFVSCEEKPVADPASSQTVVVKDSNIIRKDASNPYVQMDVSPMDMIYFPTDYPLQKMNDVVTTPPVMRVIYSRPHRGGRQLFGGLVKWGHPWRLGANEATEIEFFQPVTIQKQNIAKGQYILYAIPHENKWTLVLNKNVHTWGLKFDPNDDVAKFDVPSSQKEQSLEYFTMIFAPADKGAELIIAWENREVRLPIQF
jgi:hypothetical protein